MKMVYEYAAKLERTHNVQEFVSELFARDFYRYWFMHHGNKAFSSYGIYDRKHYNWKPDPDLVQRWKDGMTGMPLIDALMRELKYTGWMSNRGR